MAEIVRQSVRARISEVAGVHGLTLGVDETENIISRWLHLRSKQQRTQGAPHITMVICRVSSYRYMCNCLTQVFGNTPGKLCETDATASELSRHFTSKPSVGIFSRKKRDHVMVSLVQCACDFSLCARLANGLRDGPPETHGLLDDIAVAVTTLAYGSVRRRHRPLRLAGQGREMVEQFAGDSLRGSRTAVLRLLVRAASAMTSRRYVQVYISNGEGKSHLDPALKSSIEATVDTLYKSPTLHCIQVLTMWCVLLAEGSLPVENASGEQVRQRVIRAKIELARKSGDHAHLKTAARLFSTEYTCMRTMGAAVAIFGHKNKRTPLEWQRLTPATVDNNVRAQLKQLGLQDEPLDPVAVFLDLCRDDLILLITLCERYRRW